MNLRVKMHVSFYHTLFLDDGIISNLYIIVVVKIDCAVWPPLQLINFLYVSPTYRVLYVNTTNVAWNIFLSYAKHFVS